MSLAAAWKIYNSYFLSLVEQLFSYVTNLYVLIEQLRCYDHRKLKMTAIVSAIVARVISI